jgi:hypothetical protein
MVAGELPGMGGAGCCSIPYSATKSKLPANRVTQFVPDRKLPNDFVAIPNR